MNHLHLSDDEWIEIVAQLRKWVGAVVRPKPWILCGYTVDDVIGDALTRYFLRKEDRDRRICELFAEEQRRLALVRLLAVICRGVIIDRWRKVKDGLAREQSYPDEHNFGSALSANRIDQYDYVNLKQDLLDGADDGIDKAIVESFCRLSEGPLLTPNLQVADDLKIPIEMVLSFKRRRRVRS